MQGLINILQLVLWLGAPLLSWVVALILIRASRRAPAIHALKERAILALILALVGTAFVAVVFNVEAGWPLWSDNTGRVLVRIGFAILLVIPNVYWLWLYLTKGFRDSED